jgi:hypothetical protein
MLDPIRSIHGRFARLNPGPAGGRRSRVVASAHYRDAVADVIGTLLGVLEVTLAMGVVALIIVGLSRRDEARPSLADALVVPAVALSLGAAAIHLWVVPDHAAEFPPYGLAFLLVAIFQARWAMIYVARRPPSMLQLGLVVNAAVIAIWIWSRIAGLPWGATPNTPESFGGADLAATSFEIGLVAILAIQLWPGRDGPRRRQVTSRVAGDLRAIVVAAVCVFTFLALTAPQHGQVERSEQVTVDPSR